jgi:hypothetical protein
VSRVAATVALSAVVAACSSTPAGPQPSPRPTASAQAAAAPLPDASWARGRFVAYDSLAHGFSLPLPEDIGWRIEDTKGSWFVATHAAASTQIVARVLATDGLANRARCERRARDLRNLPERDGAIVLERRRVDLPDGFDTVLEVGVLPTNPGQPIAGFVLAIGGWSKKCFVYALVTRAAGPGAEEAIGDRLALFVERSFLRMRFSSDLVPLVPREKLPIER